MMMMMKKKRMKRSTIRKVKLYNQILLLGVRREIEELKSVMKLRAKEGQVRRLFIVVSVGFLQSIVSGDLQILRRVMRG